MKIRSHSDRRTRNSSQLCTKRILTTTAMYKINLINICIKLKKVVGTKHLILIALLHLGRITSSINQSYPQIN